MCKKKNFIILVIISSMVTSCSVWDEKIIIQRQPALFGESIISLDEDAEIDGIDARKTLYDQKKFQKHTIDEKFIQSNPYFILNPKVKIDQDLIEIIKEELDV